MGFMLTKKQISPSVVHILPDMERSGPETSELHEVLLLCNDMVQQCSVWIYRILGAVSYKKGQMWRLRNTFSSTTTVSVLCFQTLILSLWLHLVRVHWITMQRCFTCMDGHASSFLWEVSVRSSNIPLSNSSSTVHIQPTKSEQSKS